MKNLKMTLVYLSSIILLLFLTSCNNKNKMNSSINIIPQPSSIIMGQGSLDLRSIRTIFTKNNSKEEVLIAQFFRDLLKPINELNIEPLKKQKNNYIIISLIEKGRISEEGYNLKIQNNSILLEASTQGGLFYGFQTFRQLCDTNLEVGLLPKNIRIPECIVEDQPEFKYRGMHLDVSRHFFDITFIKTYIDMIALHKMNVFHWHLTDDNGWRIEIKKYPLLTEKSAWRVDRRNEPWKKQSPQKEKEKPTYGGFYTQDEIREVIDYAAKRNIMVIPEIEMPGHTSEVFAAYPELSCKGNYLPVNPGSYWPNVDIFCAGNDNVFKFLENVLEEVSELFPSPYLHIGGDEADKLNWESCAKCQKRIKEENLKDEHELQSWFIKKIEKFIVSKNKKLVGWDEILEGGLAKTATVMSWRGMQGGIQSAKAGHEVIMCPTSHCYFDYYQANPENSPEAFGGLITLKKVYSFNPIPNELTQDQKKLVLGAQGNLWTEYVQTPQRAQQRVLPRMTALSEVLWSGPGRYTYDNFYSRLSFLVKRYDLLNWSHSPGTFTVSINPNYSEKDKNYKINITSEKPGETILFTTDGTDPEKTSKIYTTPISIEERTTIKAAIFTNSEMGPISKKTVFFSKAMGKNVFYKTLYSDRYSGSGNLTLVDGMTGTIAHNDGYWQGWKEKDLEVVIDLENIEKINRISISFLESQKSWIFLPSAVKVHLSNDGIVFDNERIIKIENKTPNDKANRQLFEINQISTLARYIKIKGVNLKKCPEWHPGAGGETWLFADEIIIE